MIFIQVQIFLTGYYYEAIQANEIAVLHMLWLSGQPLIKSLRLAGVILVVTW